MKNLIGLLLSLVALRSQALTNSIPAEDLRWSSVVLIEINGKDDTGEVVPGYCVGSFLKNNLLLTAAHCVNDALAMNDRGIQITSGHYIYHKMPDGTQRRIGYMPDKVIKTTAQFLISNRSPGGADDLAVVVLDQALALPPNFVFAQLISRNEELGVQQNLATYTPTVVSENPFAEITTTDTFRLTLLNDLHWSMSGNYQSKSNSRLEPGDSGSPLFVKIGTQWKILAVSKGQAKTFFSDWDVYESVSANVCKTVAGRVSADLQKQLCPN